MQVSKIYIQFCLQKIDKRNPGSGQIISELLLVLWLKVGKPMHMIWYAAKRRIRLMRAKSIWFLRWSISYENLTMQDEKWTVFWMHNFSNWSKKKCYISLTHTHNLNHRHTSNLSRRMSREKYSTFILTRHTKNYL